MKLPFYLLMFTAMLFLAGCMHSPQSKWLNKLTVELAPEAQTIKYTGKGAGASFMLMSSMGPMGIAVGVAIDEGIGKDIHTAFMASDGDVKQFAASAVTDAFMAVCSLKSSASHPLCLSKDALSVNVNRLSLRAKQGDPDSVWADVELTVTNESYTQSLNVKERNICTKVEVPFDKVKVDGAVTKTVLSSCVYELIAALVAPSSS